MSKTIYYVRHAKSSWDNPGLADMNRPLNRRGERDAPRMGKFLASKEGKPDVLISSPAERALATAKHFQRAFGMPSDKLVIETYLYHASPDELIDVVQQLDPEVEVACVFGHNPGMTFLANMFTLSHIDNVPTCGVFKIEAEVDQWKNFSPDSGHMTSFYYPKKHLV